MVIKTGKKQSSAQPNIHPDQHPNSNYYDRDWSFVDVYQIDLSGKIIGHQAFDNRADGSNLTITVSPDNWQKPWLETWQDYKAMPGQGISSTSVIYDAYVIGAGKIIDYPNQPAYEEDEFITRAEEPNRFYTSEPTNLLEAFRTFFSDRYTLQLCRRFTPDQEFYLRNSIHVSRRFSGYGTLAPEGFIFVEPKENLHKDIDLRPRRAGTSGNDVIRPGVNDSFLYALVEGRQINPSKRSVSGTTQFSAANNYFDPIQVIAIESPSTFPNLILPDGADLYQGNVGFDALCYLGTI